MTSGAHGGIEDQPVGHRSQQLDDLVDHDRPVLEPTHASTLASTPRRSIRPSWLECSVIADRQPPGERALAGMSPRLNWMGSGRSRGLPSAHREAADQRSKPCAMSVLLLSLLLRVM